MPAAAKSSCTLRGLRSPTAFPLYYTRALWNCRGCWVAYVVQLTRAVRKTHTLASGIRTSSAVQNHVWGGDAQNFCDFQDVRCLCTASCHPRRDTLYTFASASVSRRVQSPATQMSCMQSTCFNSYNNQHQSFIDSTLKQRERTGIMQNNQCLVQNPHVKCGHDDACKHTVMLP
jgi:hypothetical protein